MALQFYRKYTWVQEAGDLGNCHVELAAKVGLEEELMFFYNINKQD